MLVGNERGEGKKGNREGGEGAGEPRQDYDSVQTFPRIRLA